MNVVILLAVLGGTFPITHPASPIVESPRETFAITHPYHVAQKPSVATAQVHNGHWSHPEDIRTHLMNAHGFSWVQLAGRSHEALLEVHDAQHEGRCPPGTICPKARRRR